MRLSELRTGEKGVIVKVLGHGGFRKRIVEMGFIKGKTVKEGVTAIVVPGSRPVRQAAEKIGLDQIFLDAGFEWREPGCSMCLGMNPDKVPEGIHCASTSNRNFVGRQGKNARTHLCSPAMAALAAIHGQFVDVRQVMKEVI